MTKRFTDNGVIEGRTVQVTADDPKDIDLAKEFAAKANTNRAQGCCANCSKPVDVEKGFNDPLSLKEYRISGLCQSCQDVIFAEVEDDDGL